MTFVLCAYLSYFRVKTVDEKGTEVEEYYAFFEWKNWILKKLLVERYGVEVSSRTCTNLLNKLCPSNETIACEFRMIGLENMWLFMNIKVCEKLVVTQKGIENMVSYFACIAYSFGTHGIFQEIFATRSKYAEFIKKVFDNHISRESIIFFAESDSNKNTREKNSLAFCECSEKVKRAIHVTIPIDDLFENCKSIKKTGEGANRDYSFDNIYELFKEKLPYYSEYDSDSGSLKNFEQDEEAIEDTFFNFTKRLLITLSRIRASIEKAETGKPLDSIIKDIKGLFKLFEIDKKI